MPGIELISVASLRGAVRAAGLMGSDGGGASRGRNAAPQGDGDAG